MLEFNNAAKLLQPDMASFFMSQVFPQRSYHTEAIYQVLEIPMRNALHFGTEIKRCSRPVEALHQILFHNTLSDRLDSSEAEVDIVHQSHVRCKDIYCNP